MANLSTCDRTHPNKTEHIPTLGDVDLAIGLSVSFPAPHVERGERECLSQALAAVAAHLGAAARLVDVGPFAGLLSGAILGALERPKSCVILSQKSSEPLVRKLVELDTTAEIVHILHDEQTCPWPLEVMGAGRTLVLVSGGGFGLFGPLPTSHFLTHAGATLSRGDLVLLSVEHPRDGALVEIAYRDYGYQVISQSLSQFGRSDRIDSRVFYNASTKRVQFGTIAQSGASLTTQGQRLTLDFGHWLNIGGMQLHAQADIEAMHTDFEVQSQWTSQDHCISLLLLRKI